MYSIKWSFRVKKSGIVEKNIGVKWRVNGGLKTPSIGGGGIKVYTGK
jgi:hypothetical protein